MRRDRLNVAMLIADAGFLARNPVAALGYSGCGAVTGAVLGEAELDRLPEVVPFALKRYRRTLD